MTIWTLVLGYNPPMPFSVLLVIFSGNSAATVQTLLELSTILKTVEGRKRLLNLAIAATYCVGAIISYDAVTIMIEKLPFQIQWIVAIVLQMLKWFHRGTMKKLFKRVHPCNLEALHVGIATMLESNHALYVALMLVNVTEVTMYSILGIQFVMQLYSCYEIIRLHRKVQTDSSALEEINSAINDVVFDLVLVETIEALVPVVYAITFVSSYYGPNAGILGNFKNSYWQFQAKDGVTNELYLLFTLVGFDMGVGIVGALILWIFCKLNIFRAFCQFMKTYWSWMSINIALLITVVIQLY